MPEAKATEAIYYKNLYIYYEPLEIHFPGKPDKETIEKLHDHGFRARKDELGSWLWRGHDNWRARQFAESIGTFGGEVGEKMTTAQKVEQQMDRADRRSERLQHKSEKLQAEANSRSDYVHHMCEVMNGQPILIGHHSEKHHRSDLKKMEFNMRKSIELSDAAEAAARSSKVAANFEGRMMNTTTVLNRIEKLEADVRREERRIAEVQKGHPSPEEQEKLAELRVEIDYWQKYLEENERKIWTKEEFKKGELLKFRNEICIVEQTNPKSLSVRFVFKPYNDPFSTWKIRYAELPSTCKQILQVEEDAARAHISHVLSDRTMTKADFKVGDVIKFAFGNCPARGVIVKVNPKGLEVSMPGSAFGPRKVKYADLKNDCKDVPEADKAATLEADQKKRRR